MHCTVLLCVQYNVKLCCLFSSWFAKEANVANNKQWLANFMTQSQKNGNAISALRPEIKSQVQLGRLVSKASGSHHNLAPYDDIWGQIPNRRVWAFIFSKAEQDT